MQMQSSDQPTVDLMYGAPGFTDFCELEDVVESHDCYWLEATACVCPQNMSLGCHSSYRCHHEFRRCNGKASKL
jgi:hypothetical protein